MIVPKNGDFIKHKKFMDVAVYVIKAYNFDHKMKIKGIWANQQFVKTNLIVLNAHLTIKKEDLSDWYICMNPLAECIRDVEWRKLR